MKEDALRTQRHDGSSSKDMNKRLFYACIIIKLGDVNNDMTLKDRKRRFESC